LQLETLGKQLADAALYSDPCRKEEMTGLLREQAGLKSDIETLEWEWFEASEALERAGSPESQANPGSG
jgi:ATP-binding cassette subfamily F protein 3